jgi:hypothetical protein
LVELDDDNEGITWFSHVLPQIRAEEEVFCHGSHATLFFLFFFSWKLHHSFAVFQAKARAGRYEELLGLTEFIQYPGEVVLKLQIPSKHMLIILELASKVTAYYVIKTDYIRAW